MTAGCQFRRYRTTLGDILTLEYLRAGKTVGYAVPDTEAGRQLLIRLHGLGADDDILSRLTIIDVSKPA